MKLKLFTIFISAITMFLLNSNIKSQPSHNEKNYLKGGFVKSTSFKKASNNLTTIFKDDMNGDNSISGLQGRGWIIEDVDGGGDHPAWFQGNLYEVNFSAYEGNANDYVASDWLGANATYLNQWLISPQISVSGNDTISFWIQSSNAASYVDSISVYLSPNGGGSLTDFSLAYNGDNNTQRYLIPKGVWSNWKGIIPSAGTIRFAIQYHTKDADNFSWYIGIDLVEVYSSGIVITFAPTVITGSASNITSTSATLNGSVNPNDSNTNYRFEYGTSTSYGNVVTSSQVLTGSTDQPVSSTITGLNSNTVYHFRLVAENSGGTTYGNDVTFTTNSASGSNIDLEWRTLNLSSFNWSVGNAITAELKVVNNGTDTAPQHNTQIYLSVDPSITITDIALGSPISFNSIAGGDSSIVTHTFNVPNTNAGVYYVGAIVDVDNQVTESNENNNNYYRRGKIVIGYPSSIQLSTTLNFGNSSESSGYRMIGIPGNSNMSVSQVLAGTGGEDWIAYYDNGNTSDYLVKYDGTSVFNFKPGNGFWVLSKNPLNINQSLSSVQLVSNMVGTNTFELVYPISLHSGWNIISNPFENSVDWDLVKSYNSINESIHSFNGTYTTNSTLAPYTGYYFYNATNLQSLSIPYQPTTLMPKKSHVENLDETGIIISLLRNNEIKSSIRIINNEKSKTGYDKHDRYMPPADFEDYRISVFNNYLESPYKFLLVDSRRITQNQTYELQVKYPINENFILEVTSVNKIKDVEMYLTDQNSNFHNLKFNKVLKLKSFSKINNLKLLIGSKEFIEKQKSETLPANFALEQNYPNPFNPTTTIKYSISPSHIAKGSTRVGSKVTLKVYDVLGNEVATLVNKEKAPGNYTVSFDGSELTSGIYFYKLTAGNFVETKKMIILK